MRPALFLLALLAALAAPARAIAPEGDYPTAWEPNGVYGEDGRFLRNQEGQNLIQHYEATEGHSYLYLIARYWLLSNPVRCDEKRVGEEPTRICGRQWTCEEVGDLNIDGVTNLEDVYLWLQMINDQGQGSYDYCQRGLYRGPQIARG